MICVTADAGGKYNNSQSSYTIEIIWKIKSGKVTLDFNSVDIKTFSSHGSHEL